MTSTYITTPIYYVNDSPHIGHAYTSLACDVLARFLRLDGQEVRFLTGTDEHGQKVEKAAETAGVSPQAFTDDVSQRFRHLAQLMNYSNDDFIRTTEKRHTSAVQEFWKILAKKGKGEGGIYLGKYAGWYSVRDEAFYGESELIVDTSGKKTAPSGAPVEWVEEPSYFFELSKWQEPLLKFYAENPDFVYPASRFNEVKRFVEGGLEDLSVSRTSFTWGIPVPGDEKHVIYVWLDALFNYVSALEWPNGANYKKFWENSNVYHVVGKDILRFHAVYWPAFLMAAGMKPPSRVIAHGWWTNEGQKISKSLGNVIDPLKLVEEFGLDATRYFLMREVPFGNDGNYSRLAMINRVNSELANNIGNLCQRTLSIIAKNCGGKVPEVRDEALTEEDRNFLNALWVTDRDTPKAVTGMYLNCRFYEILQEIVQMAGQANEYIDKQAPWGLKDNPARRDAILYCLAEGIRCLAIYLQPFIPESASKILDYLAIPADQRGFAHTHHYGKGLGKYSLEPGTPLPAPQGVFPRYVEKAA